MSPSRRRPPTRGGSKTEVTERAQAAQLQTATYRISEAANAAEDLSELFRAIHGIISELMPAKNFYIALYDPLADLVSFPYFVDEYDTEFPSKRLGKGLTEYVLRTGQALLATPELHQELEQRGEVELIGAPSIDWLGVPLKAHERTIGVLVAQTYTEGIRFGEREKNILQFVSTQVAMAIERKRAEEAVRTSEARLKALLDSALDACVTMDETGRITSWSGAAEAVFGWAASEAIGRSLAATIIPSQHREGHARGLARFLETGEGPILRQRIEITALHRDGREFPVELTVTPIRLGDRWLFGAFVRDLTEEKRAEQALHRSEASYRGLVEHAAYGIYRATGDGKLLMVNPALFTILGYGSAQELLKVDIARDLYVDPKARVRILERCEQFGSAIEEVAWRRRDGRVITVRLNGRTVRAPDGALECFEFIVDDVTEQRALEERLRQTQKMEAVGRLAGGIAHDFNNLLTAILGSVDFLRRALGPEHPEHAETEEIQKAAVRAADLTRQLLAFSRQQVLAPKVLELDALVTNLEKMLRRLIGEDVELRFAAKASRAAVRADPGQLEQVIVNLVVNARDAMPRGGRLTIETARVDLDAAYAWEHGTVEPGRYVMLAVTDTGVGIDRAAQARLFEPFFTTKEFGKGTGLGLATVYGIVRASGGGIDVESRPGAGTTFRIYLPASDDAPALRGRAVLPPESGRGETILVVEDEDPVRTLLRRILVDHGYRVLEARDGADGLRRSQEHGGEIHLLLTDVVMPEMTGPELARH